MNSRACSSTAVGRSDHGLSCVGRLPPALAIVCTASAAARAVPSDVPVRDANLGMPLYLNLCMFPGSSERQYRSARSAWVAPYRARCRSRSANTRSTEAGAQVRAHMRLFPRLTLSQVGFRATSRAALRWPCLRVFCVGTTLTPNNTFQPTSHSSLRSSCAAAELPR